MRLVVQRVLESSVKVDGREVGRIGKGFMVLCGVEDGDTAEDVRYCVDKTVNLRIFEDENDKMNLSVKDICGGALIVSNFTLCANYAHGNRPDYMNAEIPQRANELYEYFVELMKERTDKVQTGVFGAHMMINMEADGPITIVMDSEVLNKKRI